MEIKKVYTNKQTGQKLITVPRSSDIKDGDYVRLIKMEDKFDCDVDGK